MIFTIIRTTSADETGGLRAQMVQRDQLDPTTLMVRGVPTNKLLLDQLKVGNVVEITITDPRPQGIVTPPGPAPDPVPEPRA